MEPLQQYSRHTETGRALITVDHITGFYVLLSFFMTLSVGPTKGGTDASLLLLRLLVPKSAKNIDYQTPQYGSTLRARTALKVGAD